METPPKPPVVRSWEGVIAAALIALGIAAAGYLSSGRFETVAVSGESGAFVVDRLTGDVRFCQLADKWAECGRLADVGTFNISPPKK